LASARGYHAEMPFAISASGPLPEELLAKNGVPGIPGVK